MIEIDGSYSERGDLRISITRITEHLRTNRWVINQFLPLETDIKEEGTRAVVALKSP